MRVRLATWLTLVFIADINLGNARDYFTEEFNGDFDLSFSTLTFKPDRSSNGYAVCKLPATEFPTPLTDGFTVSFYPWPKFVSEGVWLHEERYSTFNVNPNGSVTFGTGTEDLGSASLSNHF